MKKANLLFALLCVAAPAWAAGDTYVVDASHTYPQFEVNHLGFSLQRGRFDKVSGSVVLDRAAKTGSVDITIDTASINTGWAERDAHLKKAEFFDVEMFPTMQYKSRSFKFSGDKLVEVAGDLTLRGVTKPVNLSVSHFHCGQHPMNKKQVCGAEASATLKRSDFGMSAYVPAVGDEVKLSLQIEAVKQ